MGMGRQREHPGTLLSEMERKGEREKSTVQDKRKDENQEKPTCKGENKKANSLGLDGDKKNDGTQRFAMKCCG